VRVAVSKLIVALLNKVPKSSVFISNKSSEEHLLLLDGPKGVLEIGIVRRGWLRGITGFGLTRMRGGIMGCGLDDLGYPVKVSPVK